MRIVILSLNLKMGNEKITSFCDIFFCGIEKACLFQQKNMVLLADFIKKLGIEERLDSYLPDKKTFKRILKWRAKCLT